MRDIFSDSLRQLNKLSIYKPMQFRVTEIEFNFDDSASYDKEPGYFQTIIEETLSTTWEASDADDLVEEITNATGWCVNSIDYCYVLQ
jgi:hypothetical protein